MMIKSYPNGITLRLDPETPFPDLLEDTAEQFRKNRKFFGNAHLAMRIEGRPLTKAQEDALLEVVLRESDLKINCLLVSEGEEDTLFVKALRQEGLISGDPGADLRLFTVRQGSLTPGETLYAERNLLMAGDVPEGAELHCEGSVILLGTLEGRLTCAGPYAYVRRLQSKKITVAGMAPREKSSGLRSLLAGSRDCLLVADRDILHRIEPEDLPGWLSENTLSLFGSRPAEEELI